jgi:ketosteroid isomerase-like protein
MGSTEDANVQVLGQLAVLAKQYASGQISGVELGRELSSFMSPDVEFRSNYVPSWPPLRPLFAARRGIDAIVDRYDYEQEHETIEDDSGVPYGIAVAGDVAYYSQRETASFLDGPTVTWDMVTRVAFRDGRIARLRMYLDAAPIERAYPAAGPDRTDM